MLFARNPNLKIIDKRGGVIDEFTYYMVIVTKNHTDYFHY